MTIIATITKMREGAAMALLAALPLALSGAAPSHAQAQAAAAPAPAPEAPVNTAFLKQTDDVSAVTQVILRERQGRDRGWWNQMESTYWPDSRVDLSWYHGDGPGFVAGSKKLYERGARPVHRMFAPVIDIRGNKAHAEAATLTFSTMEFEGKMAYFQTAMRLNYRLEKREGEWRILSMNPIYEYAAVSPAAPGEVIAVPAAELAKFRSSYALLSWQMSKRGIPLSQEELGVDRPAQLAEFYAGIKKWLNQ